VVRVDVGEVSAYASTSPDQAWADDVVGLCDALGVVKPIVLGSSFGGRWPSVTWLAIPTIRIE
jgi:pimeloyl-ACP methyl ester carboxylesterase